MISKIRIIIEDEDLDIEFDCPDVGAAVRTLVDYKPVVKSTIFPDNETLYRLGSSEVAAKATRISKIVKDRYSTR